MLKTDCVIAVICLLSSVGSGSHADTAESHFIPATIACAVDEVDLIPEGIAYDNNTGRLTETRWIGMNCFTLPQFSSIA